MVVAVPCRGQPLRPHALQVWRQAAGAARTDQHVSPEVDKTFHEVGVLAPLTQQGHTFAGGHGGNSRGACAQIDVEAAHEFAMVGDGARAQLGPTARHGLGQSLIRFAAPVVGARLAGVLSVVVGRDRDHQRHRPATEAKTLAFAICPHLPTSVGHGLDHDTEVTSAFGFAFLARVSLDHHAPPFGDARGDALLALQAEPTVQASGAGALQPHHQAAVRVARQQRLANLPRFAVQHRDGLAAVQIQLACHLALHLPTQVLDDKVAQALERGDAPPLVLGLAVCLLGGLIIALDAQLPGTVHDREWNNACATDSGNSGSPATAPQRGAPP